MSKGKILRLRRVNLSLREMEYRVLQDAAERLRISPSAYARMAVMQLIQAEPREVSNETSAPTS